jgi:serine/threonine protein kinase
MLLFASCLFLLLFALGAFGNVRVGWLKTKKSQKYAVKTMKKAEIIKSKHVDHIENEKNILEKIQHPFVVSISNDAKPTHLCLHGYYLS